LIRERWFWSFVKVIVEGLELNIIEKVKKVKKVVRILEEIKKAEVKIIKKLMANKIPEKFWMHLIVNFIKNLLLVVGKDATLVVCNRLSKIVNFVVTTEKV